MSGFRTKSTVKKVNKRNRSVGQTERKIFNDQKKEFAHADFIERLIIGKNNLSFFFLLHTMKTRSFLIDLYCVYINEKKDGHLCQTDSEII
jgi:hypothetical protein